MVADASHEVYVDTILETIRNAAAVRGTGIAERIAVAQPFLDLLHGNAVCQKKAGTTMAQIVEADAGQAIL